MKYKKFFIVFTLLALLFSACTKYDANSIALPETASTCSSDMEGDNVFKGYLLDYSLEGILAVSISEVGGISATGSNVTINAFLEVNGQQYCCSSTGMAYLLKYSPDSLPGDYGSISTTPLMCTPISGAYTQFNINLGVDCGPNSLHRMYFKSDTHGITGCISVDNPMAANRVIQITD